MLLKPTEKTFKATVEGIGEFIFKYPKLTDELQIDAKASQFLDGNATPSVVAVNIAYEMATLAQVIVKAPEGWDLENLYKFSDLDAVYQVYLQKIKEFRGDNTNTDKKEGSAEGKDA